MENDLVLGIDAGTAGVRAGIFNLQGQPLGFSEQSYQTFYPQPGWAEQDPAHWWAALVQAVKHCLHVNSIDGQRVAGLAIDAPCNILLTNHAGEPLTRSLIWMDLRATEQAKKLTATADSVLRYCGGDVPAEWPVPKALWLKQHEAALWNQNTYLVDQMGWLTWKLTGEWAVSLNCAAAKWHYRASSDEMTPAGWPITLLRAVGLEDLATKIPGRVLPMGAQAGELTNEAAEQLGLRPGIAVSMSGIDAHAGMVGLNVLAPGTLALITGTSTCQLVQSSSPVVDRGLWGPFESAVVVGDWTLEAGQASTGGTVRWLLDTLGGALPAGDERYSAADAAAAAVKPGADGLTVLDFWQGSRTPIKDPHARGTIWGLTSAHTPGHLLRAVYEGTAYGNRHILTRLNELQVPTNQIIACGGGTRSSLWLQILADVAGLPISLTAVPDAVSLGSAICAAVGVGAFADLRAAGQAMVRLEKTIEPDPTHRAIYDEGYTRYRATYEAMAPLFQRAAFAEK
ncbi:carbohydrate kinase [Dictyobacter sp. S3.2.2.5]|uniref:Carbohydrate kinase n=1 Tax=Dictyobacter halimunensis TaxID=3026934 RepID=A0ABQ6FLP9_9CHLR|nr:carbohydrate kinase [Dictyobacter sp. S3.2.2.5]